MLARLSLLSLMCSTFIPKENMDCSAPNESEQTADQFTSTCSPINQKYSSCVPHRRAGEPQSATSQSLDATLLQVRTWPRHAVLVPSNASPGALLMCITGAERMPSMKGNLQDPATSAPNLTAHTHMPYCLLSLVAGCLIISWMSEPSGPRAN